MQTVTDFIFLGSKTTVDGGCSHEIKRRLLHSISPGGMHERSGLVRWEDPEGSGAEGGGKGDRDGEHM